MIIIALLLILLACTTLTYYMAVQVGKVIGHRSARLTYEARVARYYRSLRPGPNLRGR